MEPKQIEETMTATDRADAKFSFAHHCHFHCSPEGRDPNHVLPSLSRQHPHNLSPAQQQPALRLCCVYTACWLIHWPMLPPLPHAVRLPMLRCVRMRLLNLSILMALVLDLILQRRRRSQRSMGQPKACMEDHA